MKQTIRARQRGITFLGLLFTAGFLACVGVVAAQVFPTLVEYYAVNKAVQKASGGQTMAEVREIFVKAAAIDDIKSITADQLEVTKENEKVMVKFAYIREIHLAGPAYLTLKYAGQSK